MKRTSWKVSLLSAGLVMGTLGAMGCGDGGSMTTGMGGMGGTSETTIELFSWWVAPGEAEALQALIDLNRTQHPSERIFNAGAVSGMDARALLAQRLADNNPPTCSSRTRTTCARSWLRTRERSHRWTTSSPRRA